jgi:hypothetical protein
VRDSEMEWRAGLGDGVACGTRRWNGVRDSTQDLKWISGGGMGDRHPRVTPAGTSASLLAASGVGEVGSRAASWSRVLHGMPFWLESISNLTCLCVGAGGA